MRMTRAEWKELFVKKWKILDPVVNGENVKFRYNNNYDGQIVDSCLRTHPSCCGAMTGSYFHYLGYGHRPSDKMMWDIIEFILWTVRQRNYGATTLITRQDRAGGYAQINRIMEEHGIPFITFRNPKYSKDHVLLRYWLIDVNYLDQVTK